MHTAHNGKAAGCASDDRTPLEHNRNVHTELKAGRLAGEYPEIQFCQATCYNANEEPFYDNYHTFMGEIYEGRYIAGIVAGMKL